MGFESLADIFKLAQKRHPEFARRIKEAQALQHWDQAVGRLIAKHTRPIKVFQSILWVVVEHPIWKSELHYRKQQILEILNRSQDGQEDPEILFRDIYYLDPHRTNETPKNRFPRSKGLPLKRRDPSKK